jgi:Fe-S-cluster containining protein
MSSKRPRPINPSPELKVIWDKVPAMKNCQGKCQASCGPIPVSGEERKLIEQRSGHGLDMDPQSWTCNMLSKTGYCTVYSVRPLLCRIWGATEKLPCPFGCEPERVLTQAEAADLFAELEAISGDDDSKAAVLEMLSRMGPKQRAEWEVQRRKWNMNQGVSNG